MLAFMPHPERTSMADVASWAFKEEVLRWGTLGRGRGFSLILGGG